MQALALVAALAVAGAGGGKAAIRTNLGKSIPQEGGSPLLAKYVFGPGVAAGGSYGTPTWTGLGTPTLSGYGASSGGTFTTSGVTLTGSGTTTTSPYATGGVKLAAVAFDGSTTRMTGGTSAGHGTGSKTICARFKTNTIGAATKALISVDSGSGVERQYRVYVGTSAVLNVHGATEATSTPVPIVASAWNSGCFAYIASGPALRVNVNGVAPAEVTLDVPVSLNAAVSTDFVIGSNAAATPVAFWPGDIAEWAVFEGIEPTAAQLATAVRSMQGSLGLKPPDGVVTVTNSGTENVQYGAEGLLYKAAANAPRIDYAKGLAVFGTNKNWVLYSEAFDDAAWAAVTAGATSPGDTAVTAAQADGPDGTALTADQIAVPACADADDVSARCADFTATAAIWTGSVFLKTASGTANPFLYLWDGAAAYHSAQCSASTTWSRCTVKSAANLSAATWKLCIGNSRAGGQADAGGDTVLAFGAQAEVGSIPGPYIATAGTALDRPSTVASVANAAPALGPRCYGIVAASGGTWATSGHLFGVGSYAGANSAHFYFASASRLQLATYGAGGGQRYWYSGGLTWSDRSSHSAAVCWDLNGVASMSADLALLSLTEGGAWTGTPNAEPTTAYPGSTSSGAGTLNGHISRFAFCKGTNPLACEKELLR